MGKLKPKLGILLWLALWLLAGHATAEPIRRWTLVYDVEIDGRQYTAQVVLSRNQLVRVNKDPRFLQAVESMRGVERTESYSNALLKYAQKWLLQWYRKRGLLDGEHTQAMEKALTETESMLDPNSAFVILSEKDHPEKIKAMVRFDNGGMMSFEKRLLGRRLTKPVPRPPIEYREEVEPLWVFPKGSTEGTQPMTGPLGEHGLVDYNGTPIPNLVHDSTVIRRRTGWWGGGAGEIKNLAHDPEGGEDLLPLLFYLAELHQINRWSSRRVTLKPYQQDPEFRKRFIADHGYPPTIYHGDAPVQISEYWGECDSKPGDTRLLEYYLSIGWEIYRAFENPDIPGNTTYVIRLSRERYLSILEKNYFARPGGQALPRMQLRLRTDWYAPFRRCRDLWRRLHALFGN